MGGPVAEVADALVEYAAVGFRHPILIFRSPWDLETIRALGAIRAAVADRRLRSASAPDEPWWPFEIATMWETTSHSGGPVRSRNPKSPSGADPHVIADDVRDRTDRRTAAARPPAARARARRAARAARSP